MLLGTLWQRFSNLGDGVVGRRYGALLLIGINLFWTAMTILFIEYALGADFGAGPPRADSGIWWGVAIDLVGAIIFWSMLAVFARNWLRHVKANRESRTPRAAQNR
jgi:hypothetical protein